MKQSEAVTCRQRFTCPVNGCNISQRWLSLCRHLVLFHDWEHSRIDKWRDSLTMEDSAGVEQPSDRKRSSDAPREKRQPPPPPKPVLAAEWARGPRPREDTSSGFPLHGTIRFKKS